MWTVFLANWNKEWVNSPPPAIKRSNGPLPCDTMKILITGGTGFLGGATAIRLKKLGHEVTVIGRSVTAGNFLEEKGVCFLKADIRDRTTVVRACKGMQAIIHCAALASPWGKYQDFYDANVLGTRHVLQGALEYQVPRFVNLSTPSVYFDYQHRVNIKESDPLPQIVATHYAGTKRIADTLVSVLANALLVSLSLRKWIGKMVPDHGKNARTKPY